MPITQSRMHELLTEAEQFATALAFLRADIKAITASGLSPNEKCTQYAALADMYANCIPLAIRWERKEYDRTHRRNKWMKDNAASKRIARKVGYEGAPVRREYPSAKREAVPDRTTLEQLYPLPDYSEEIPPTLNETAIRHEQDALAQIANEFPESERERLLGRKE